MALKPGATIGIMGGGQLGRMLAMAAAHMGYHTHIYTPEKNSPASQVTNHVTAAGYDDVEALMRFAKGCDVITFEFENVPHESLELLKQHCTVYPDPEILKICRHRLREKTMINEVGIGTAPFAPVTSVDELKQAVEQIGTPCVLKSCELGYDGKGQVKISTPEEAEEAWNALKTSEAILEGWIPFQCEISVIVGRDQRGYIATYEPSHNLHENHILARTKVPCSQPDAIIGEAKKIAIKLAEKLQLVGIVAVEMFVLKDGKLLVNELAPRPHNSGHWTMEAAATSQFEQQIRAIAGLSLGDTATLCPSEMVNLIDDQVNDLESYQRNAKAHIHHYGKSEVRAGRKMGHVTILSA